MNKKEKIRKLKKSNFEKKQKTKQKKNRKKEKVSKKKKKKESLWMWITFIIHSDLGMRCKEQ
jgi:predicted tellurium resistance membrane protein TerC